ncbi:MAG: cytochrome-c peroxidase [Flavobacteriales bacterium]
MRNVLWILGMVWLASLPACRCKDEPDPPAVEFQATPYSLVIPPLFPQMDIPADNPLTVEGISLGRYLFWEKKLSGDNTQSCGSCHLPEHGFSDPNRYSVGIDGSQGNRQAMALVNLGWAYNYFWDGRSLTLEDQVIHPVENPIEMNEDWNHALEELRADPIYPALFKAAYGTEEITRDRAAKAMASFLRTMISADSKFDRERAGTYEFTPLEEQGFNLFLMEGGMNANTGTPWGGGDCFHCHGIAGMQMGDYLMHNNGLDSHFAADPGLAAVTNNPLDSGKFKTPSLRNIELTAPYMHDGRFNTLEQVIGHYNTGGQVSTTIDSFMEGAGGGLYLDQASQMAIIAFLKTLTDTSFIHNPAYSDPH